jgi:hypothetical protein
MKLPIFYVQADLPEGVKHLVTCNAGERLSRGGKLPSELIMGVLLEPSEDFASGVRPDNFGTNTTFVHFLQQIIGKYGPDTVQLRVDAESIKNGTLYVVDERAPRPEPDQQWEVFNDDILGEFDVKNGFIVPDSYRPNRDYRVLSSRGFPQLEDEMMEFLVWALDELPEPEGDFIAGDWQMIN